MNRNDIKSQKVKITLVKSVISALPKQRRTIKALGLTGKISGSRVMANDDVTWGMINVVRHLVKVEEAQ